MDADRAHLPPIHDHTAAKFENAVTATLANPTLTTTETAQHLLLTRILYGVTATELHTYLTTRTRT